MKRADIRRADSLFSQLESIERALKHVRNELPGSIKIATVANISGLSEATVSGYALKGVEEGLTDRYDVIRKELHELGCET